MNTDAPGIPATSLAVVRLLNSRPHAIHGDRLDDRSYVDEMLALLELDAASVSADEVDELRTLRDDLEAVVLAEPGQETDAWNGFSEHTSGVLLRQIFSAPGAVVLKQVAGTPVSGAVALAVADLVGAQNFSRLRFCANPGCQGAFYDTTRSRTQRWDSYETCGNKANVAAHRARKAAAEA